MLLTKVCRYRQPGTEQNEGALNEETGRHDGGKRTRDGKTATYLQAIPLAARLWFGSGRCWRRSTSRFRRSALLPYLRGISQRHQRSPAVNDEIGRDEVRICSLFFDLRHNLRLGGEARKFPANQDRRPVKLADFEIDRLGQRLWIGFCAQTRSLTAAAVVDYSSAEPAPHNQTKDKGIVCLRKKRRLERQKRKQA